MGVGHHENGDAELGSAGRTFGVTSDKLVDLVESRDFDYLASVGGITGLADRLNTSVEYGLSQEELQNDSLLSKRREAFGENHFKYPPPKSFLKLCLLAFKDYTIIILTVAAIVSLIINLAVAEHREEFGYIEAIAIVIVVLVVVLMQAGIDYSKERKFRKLNSVKDNYDVQVARAGTVQNVKSSDILVGDLMKVSAGDKLAADAVLVHSSLLKTNESAMTGEPIDIEKTAKGDSLLMSGTAVSEGTGFALVVAVGENSQWGVILAGLIVEPEETPLQERLNRLAMAIGKVGTLTAALVFFVALIRWIATNAERGDWSNGLDILEFFIDAVTIIVVAVPEGLPLAITLGLAFAMRKMMQDQNLVRRLEACETMGSATQLNADKTGTLTQNRMTVVEAYLGGVKCMYENAGGDVDSFLSSQYRQVVATSIAVNTQANLQVAPNGTVEHLGNKTECSLLEHLSRWNFEYKKLRDANPAAKVFLFDSDKKRMSTVQTLGGSLQRVHCKGAPEIVLQLCNSQMVADGSTRPLSEADRTDILAHVEEMASHGLRTLLLCFRDVDHDIEDEKFWAEAPEYDLTLLGIFGIKDPVRPETFEAVKLLKGAGVTVRMVTGDNALTARFIAQEAGILDPDGIVMEGSKFRALSDEEKTRVALKLQVLARSTPNDKLVLVRTHRRMGEVVSVTGDGTNDAPALKEADVGFALGVAGTDIAKEASDIIIMDDNISSMAKAVLWGRNVYESIRKFLQFQLVVNVVALTLNFLSACTGRSLPLGPVPLLWVNMIMDSMGALALATEPPRMALMEKQPFGRTAPLINRAMWRNIIGVSVYQLVVSLVLQYAGESIFGTRTELQINSTIFNTFVFMQVFNEICSRRIEEANVFSGIFRSPYFLGIIVFTVALQLVIMLAIAGTTVGDAINITKLTGAEWGASIVLGAISLPYGILLRFWPMEWSIGPMDEDPVAQSKLEKLLHLPKRKAKAFELAEKEGEPQYVDADGTSPPKDDAAAGAGGVGHKLLRLRVFVHAVAFVNAIRRVSNDRRIEYKPVPVELERRTILTERFRAGVHAVHFINKLNDPPERSLHD